MNIKTKILVPSVVAVAIMLLLGVVSYLGLRSMQQVIDTIVGQSIEHDHLITSSRDELLQANVGVYRLLTTIANLDEARIKTESAAVLGHADKSLELLKKMQQRPDLDDGEKKILASIDELIVKYRKTVVQAIDMAQSDLAAGTGMMQAADKRFLEIDGIFDKFLEAQAKETSQMVSGAKAGVSRTIAINIGLFLAGLVATMAISLYFAGKIVRPIIDAIRTARSIAGGNLTNTIDTRGSDETGELSRGLASMQDSLRQLIARIGTNARETAASCGTMGSSLKQINESVSGQNDATASVAAAVEEMSVSINNIHDNASQALSANQASSKLAIEGAAIIQGAFDEMMNISGAVADAANVVGRVGAQSNEISTIVRVIREVADQTNLLALNAAIEAARAGEAGRGFAVVADEVRKLAEKTAGSAAEITRMIAAIQESSGQAVSNIQNVVTQVQQTATHAGTARDSIERIRANAGQSEGFAHEITAALDEQSQASNLIAQQVEGITQMSERNSQSVASAGTAMRELEEESRALEAAVAHFKV